MYGSQQQLLNALRDYLPEEAAKTLSVLLGNDRAELQHSGRMIVAPTLKPGATGAALELSNYNSAGKPNARVDPANLDNGRALHVRNGSARFDGPTEIIKWAKLTTAVTAVAGNESYADANPVENSAGDDPDTAHTLRLYYARSGAAPSGSIGDVVRYMHDLNGRAWAFQGTHASGGAGTATLFIEFTLTQAMGASTPGQATATVTDYFGGSNPGASLTVCDTQNLYREAESGSKGLAVEDTTDSKFKIIDMGRTPQRAMRVQFTAIQPWSAGETQTIVDSVAWWDGYDAGPAARRVTIKNSYGVFTGAVGAKGRAEYRPEFDDYEIDWVECGSGGSNRNPENNIPAAQTAAFAMPAPGV